MSRVPWLLAWRWLADRPARSALLLGGYGLGVAVMIALLSVGDALLVQARDRDLASGGDVVLLPEGVDPAVLKVNGITGLYFTIPHAGFLVRDVLGGPRFREEIAAAAPELSRRLVYVRLRGRVLPADASAGIPSLDRAARASDAVPDARDSPRDEAWLHPPAGAFYDRIDHFHAPAGPPRDWAEWDYFTFEAPTSGAYGYLTLLAGGEGRGTVLFRWREAGHGVLDVALPVPVRPGDLSLRTAAQHLGPARVWVEGNAYRVTVADPRLRLDLRLVPAPGYWLPPIQMDADGVRSGYVVPVVRGWVSGTVRLRGVTHRLAGALGYHDHNWGTWRGVTWEWGEASSPAGAVLYGALHTDRPSLAAGRPPVLFLWGSGERGGRGGFLGAAAIQRIVYDGWHPGPRVAGRRVRAPGRVTVVAGSGPDRVTVTLRVRDALGSLARPARAFLQLRGEATLRGTLDGRPLLWRGPGVAETFVPLPPGPPASPSPR